MSHGITEQDAGAVGYCGEMGGPWHGLPQYVTYDEEVPYEVVLNLFDFPIIKSPVAIPANVADDGTVNLLTQAELTQALQAGAPVQWLTQEDMYVLTRTDSASRVFDVSVGEGYTVYENTRFLEAIKAGLLDKYPQVKLISAGTMFGGRKSFISILLDKYHVKGDNSETVNKLLLAGYYGGGSNVAGAHGTRIVCNNTLRASLAEAAANKSLKKFRHTRNVGDKIEQHVFDLAEVFGKLEDHKAKLNHLASVAMREADVSAFLDLLVPLPEATAIDEDNRSTGKKRSVSMATSKRDKILDLFENADDLQGGIARTRYAMAQAVVDYEEHHKIRRNADDAYVYMDQVQGRSADFCDQALAILTPDGALDKVLAS